MVAMTLVLALHGKGFAEFGTKGLRAEEVVEQGPKNHQRALARQVGVIRRADRNLRAIHSIVNDLQEEQRSHDRRLEKLERRR
jgi:hypothetical protein